MLFAQTLVALTFLSINTVLYLPIAEKLNKLLVIEEFDLPRDLHSFDSNVSTSFRDKYYKKILSFTGNQPGGNS